MMCCRNEDDLEPVEARGYRRRICGEDVASASVGQSEAKAEPIFFDKFVSRVVCCLL